MQRHALCHRFLVPSLLFAVSGAASPKVWSPVGEWVLPLGSRNLIVLSIASADGQGSSMVTGSLSRPQHFDTSDMSSFTHIRGGVAIERIVHAEWKGDSLALTVQNAKDDTDKTTYLFTLKDDSHADLHVAGVPLPPINLVLAHGTPSVATDWDQSKTYSPDDDFQSNSEMNRIFEEDQRVRQPGLNIDWTSVNKSDAERRQRTKKLLDEGALHTADDFTWASFIFQHGSTPNDYLLAHTLAMVAVKKGSGNAIWIATATLDRYLQSVKQPQIYGTQFLTPQGSPTTQEPYDRSLISDALRHQLGVPILAAQELQRKHYDSERKDLK